MLTNELVNRIRFKAADEDAVQYTDDHILQVINEAHRFIMNIYIEEFPDVLTEDHKYELPKGENVIKLSEAPLRIVGVRCNGKLLHHAFEKDIKDQEATGTPKYFVLRKECLKIYPVPQEDYKILISMIGETKELRFNEELPYPQDFVDYLVEFVVARLGTVDGASVNMEMGIFAELRNMVLNTVQKLVPDNCVVDSYY